MHDELFIWNGENIEKCKIRTFYLTQNIRKLSSVKFSFVNFFSRSNGQGVSDRGFREKSAQSPILHQRRQVFQGGRHRRLWRKVPDIRQALGAHVKDHVQPGNAPFHFIEDIFGLTQSNNLEFFRFFTTLINPNNIFFSV